ncbi:MAG: GDSL-type esterase/lipase family protein [Phenylobacterium sp.]|nr:GDSL-type esterase/lipase family protein [Phenylobacterium sp.]
MRILAFGDSFVAGAGDPAHQGWLGRALVGRPEVTAYNLGVRGDTSADVLARWSAEAEVRLTMVEPCGLVFAFGRNDANALEDRPRLSAAESLKNTHQLLSQGALRAPVLMVGPPPADAPALAARVEDLNEAFKALCARLQTPYIDVLRPLAVSGTWLAEARAGDGAHPGAAGYQQMADLIAAHPAWRRFTGIDGIPT